MVDYISIVQEMDCSIKTYSNQDFVLDKTPRGENSIENKKYIEN